MRSKLINLGMVLGEQVVFALQAGLPTVAIDYTLGRGKVGHLAARAGIPCHRPDSIDPKGLAHDLAGALVSEGGAGRVIGDTFATAFKSGMARLLQEP